MTTQHFYAAIRCSQVIGLDGKERDSYSFDSGRADTLIGRTIGRLYIAWMRAKFFRLRQRDGDEER
jgi:hypothetical protein